jgi:hypothetical protein
MFEFETLVPVNFLCCVILVDDGSWAVKHAVVDCALVDETGVDFKVVKTAVTVGKIFLKLSLKLEIGGF